MHQRNRHFGIVKNQSSIIQGNLFPALDQRKEKDPINGSKSQGSTSRDRTRNANVNSSRNASHHARSSHNANMGHHVYPRNYNDHVSYNNSNYCANDYSKDSIVIIFPNNNNNIHAYRDDPKYRPRSNPYHIGNREHASRNDIVYVNDYPMPRFVYASTHLPYDVLTPGPLDKKGTKRFN